MAGNQPGNGRESPFGNGAGKSEASMAQGSNFVSKPNGGADVSNPPRDFVNASRGQSAAGQRTNTSDAADGPATAAEVVNRPGAGVGSVGNAQRPFKLGG